MNYLKIKFQNDSFFRENNFPDMKSEVFTDYKPLEKVQRKNYYSVQENIVKKTTVQTILDCPHGKRVTALNFANAMYAGGAYVLGGNAQEESLCRASMLYYTIKTCRDYYTKNRLHVLPDYTNTAIYSENVPIIRGDCGTLLENFTNCDFITIPAVNRRFAKFMFSGKNLDKKMRSRIEMILSIALEKNTDVLILGAFGCGVFGNSREKVFGIFEELINYGVPDFVEVIFAVPD